MTRSSKPKSGSMQFWHRKRAKRIYPRVRSFSKNAKIPGFAGYKVGMTHAIVVDNRQHSATKGDKIFTPITIVECPPLKTLSLRFYKKTPYGLKLLTEIFSKKLDKELGRKIKLPKKTKEIKIPEDYDELRLLFYTQPKLTGLEKKKPEIFEVLFNGELEEAKNYLDKEIKVTDVFKPGQRIDIHAVTKGKGLQGVIKRFGVSLKSHKSEKKRRSTGNLGAWTPKKVSPTVAQKGQMGYHVRTEYNKQILKIDSDPKKINQVGGFKRFGLVKNDYILLRGSIAGPTKRLIRLTTSIRGKKDLEAPEFSFLSLKSKQ